MKKMVVLLVVFLGVFCCNLAVSFADSAKSVVTEGSMIQKSSFASPQFEFALATERAELEKVKDAAQQEELLKNAKKIGIILLAILEVLICFVIVKRQYYTK